MPFLLIGIASVGWAGFSLFTGKGYYRGCPPGGFDRAEHPFSFWIPTLIILGTRHLHDSDFSGMDSVAATCSSRLRRRENIDSRRSAANSLIIAPHTIRNN